MLVVDPRNENVIVNVCGDLVPRDEAKVSVLDSSVQGGDAVWEGLRIYDGRIFQLDAHLERLFASAHAMAYANLPSKDEVKQAIFDTLRVNDMRDGVWIRLTLTRGRKTISGMDPRLNKFGPCLIVLPEWKTPIYDKQGIRLITASIRRNNPQCIDSKIHHTNLINNILAKIEANVAGVDDALMLDLAGFVSETNATNVFIINQGIVYTPHADSCLPGITRGLVIEIAESADIPIHEKNLSVSEIYTADEMFVTGTVGELVPVIEVDGRSIGTVGTGEITQRLQALFARHVATEGEPLPF